MVIFTLEFLFPGYYHAASAHINIIYPAVLILYTGQKEITRWSQKRFQSLFSGEAFVLLWSALFIAFVLFAFLSRGKYHVSLEMSVTYVTVLSIYAIGLQSKIMRKDR